MCTAAKGTPALDPGKLYAVAPSPFFASSVESGAPQGSEAAGDTMVTFNVTADTHVPARRVTLPSWFAAEFCTFHDVASLPADPPEGTAFVHEQEAIDPVPRMLINTSRSLPAMKRVGGLHCFSASSLWTAPPVNVNSTAEERAAFATASVAFIFKTLGTVPRGVVPSLVLEYVVAPYAAGVRCTMEQGMLGVTELTQTQAVTLRFGSGATPNLKKLTLLPDLLRYTSYEGPLPPSITSLVLGPERFSVRNLNTAPLLATLVITSSFDHRDLPSPLPTVVRLTLPGLGNSTMNDNDNAPTLECLRRAFPNVTFLRVLTSSWHAAFADKSLFPHLTELDAKVKTFIWAGYYRNGWQRLTVRDDEQGEQLMAPRHERAIILPKLRHLALLFPLSAVSVLEAPALQTLYLTASDYRPWVASYNVPSLFANAPDLQHVSIDAPPTENNDPRVHALVVDIAAKVGPSLRFVTCRPGRVWGLSPEKTWVEGAVVPPHLMMHVDGETAALQPPSMCQCLLAPGPSSDNTM